MVGFIHIPKTGGSYVAGTTTLRRHGAETPTGRAVRPLINFGHTVIVAGKDSRNYLHYPQEMSRAHWHGVHKKDFALRHDLCTNVRNPFSWLVSYYCAATAGKQPHPDGNIARKPFREFIKILASRTECWPGKRLLFFQMFCSDGDMIIDWVNRQEQLDEDAELMAQHYDLQYIKKEKFNAYPHKDYREYYDNDTIEIVSETWARELGLFGYSFDGLTETPIIERLNTEKNRIKYFMEKDMLLIDNKIYTG